MNQLDFFFLNRQLNLEILHITEENFMLTSIKVHAVIQQITKMLHWMCNYA